MNAGFLNSQIPQKRWACWSIFFLSFLVYSKILGNGFLNFDDAIEPILHNPFLTGWDWDHLKMAFSQQTAGYYDPVYVLSFGLDYWLWKMNPAGFHFDNLVLHTINSILVFLILANITGRQSLALMAAYLFTVHPIQVESVCWASNRANVLSLAFALAAFLLYLRGVSATTRGFVGYTAGSICLLILGMMTKPTIIVLPLLILFADLLMNRHPRPWARVFLYQGLCWGTLGLYVLLTIGQAVGEHIKPEIQIPFNAQINLFADLHAYFIKLILFPINLSALYLIKTDNAISFPRLLFYVAILVPMTTVAILIMRNSFAALKGRYQPSPLLWGTAVYFIGLFPYTNILPRTIYLSDRYEYLASIGFCTAAASVFCKIKKKDLALLAAFSIILMWSVLVVDRVAVWENSSTLWADIDSKRNISPYRRHLNMANAYAFDGRWKEAVREYEMADVDHTDDQETLLRFANTLQMAGRDDHAETIMMKILEKHPNNLPAIKRLIVLRVRKREYDKAEETLKIFRPAMTENMANHFNDLIRYDKTGKFDEAARTYRKLDVLLNESKPKFTAGELH